VSCHDYEGVMLVLFTPLQVKCYQFYFIQITLQLLYFYFTLWEYFTFLYRQDCKY